MKIEQGLLIGGSLELMYLGIIYPGGTVPACASSAALVAIPIALRTGLDAHAATVLAVPFGILGSVLWNIKYSINSTFTIRAEKSVEKKDFYARACKGIGNNKRAFFRKRRSSKEILSPANSVCRALISELAPTWRRHPDLNWG